MNHYPRHVGDWVTATAHLTEVEECIYSRMIDQYYAREQPLPSDEAAVARLVRAGSAAARKAVAVILREFFALEADGWHQKRCDDELSRYHERSESARRSINTRWEKRNKERNTCVLRTNAERNTNQNQNQNQRKTKARSTPTRERASPSALPDWLPPDAWQRWARHRGSKLTPQAVTLQLRKLAALRANGHDPQTLIDLAIESGWATFYAPRGTTAPTTGKHDARMDVADQIFKRGRYAEPNAGERDITSVAKRLD